MLSELKAGENRTVGYLTNISRDNGVVFSIRTADAKILKLTKADFESIEMRSNSEDTRELSVGCDSIKKDFYVVVTYKPEVNKKLKTEGEVLSLDFMPPEFKLID